MRVTDRAVAIINCIEFVSNDYTEFDMVCYMYSEFVTDAFSTLTVCLLL